jgi:hypothetical protein
MHQHPSSKVGTTELGHEAGDLAPWFAAARSHTELPVSRTVLQAALLRAPLPTPPVPLVAWKTASLWLAASAAALLLVFSVTRPAPYREPMTQQLAKAIDMQVPTLATHPIWATAPDHHQGTLFLQRRGRHEFTPNPISVGWHLAPGDAVRYVGPGEANIVFDICHLALGPSSTVRFDTTQIGAPRFNVVEGQARIEGLVPQQPTDPTAAMVSCQLPGLCLSAGQVSERRDGTWKLLEPLEVGCQMVPPVTTPKVHDQRR